MQIFQLPQISELSASLLNCNTDAEGIIDNSPGFQSGEIEKVALLVTMRRCPGGGQRGSAFQPGLATRSGKRRDFCGGIRQARRGLCPPGDDRLAARPAEPLQGSYLF